MKQRFILLVIIFCGYLNNLIAEPKVIKVGASLPLSGDLAFIGKDIYQGLQLAKKDYDTEDLKYEIIAEDDGFQGKNSAPYRPQRLGHY